MEKPKEKLKKILMIAGVTGAVYAGCKYLLPLVIPFFAAYGTAVLLEPSARWIQKKLSIKTGGKTWKIPIEAIGGAELAAVLLALGAGIYFWRLQANPAGQTFSGYFASAYQAV